MLHTCQIPLASTRLDRASRFSDLNQEAMTEELLQIGYPDITFSDTLADAKTRGFQRFFAAGSKRETTNPLLRILVTRCK